MYKEYPKEIVNFLKKNKFTLLNHLNFLFILFRITYINIIRSTKKDFHIHVPEGATPKDGPSAGVGMVTSIISAITEIPVNRNVAMTGEITLRGLVLPIGGLKEKLLAAHRAGIKKVLIPIENKKDLIEVPKTILESIEIIAVKNVDEVLKVALTKPLKRVEWVEVDQISKKGKVEEELSTH